MQKYFLIRGLNHLSSRFNPNYKTPSLASFPLHKLYTSKSDSSSQNPNSHRSESEIDDENPADIDDVSSAELKTQIDKFYNGDFEAIPTIFASILKRKLSGKHEDSDDELMNEFRAGQPNVDIDEEFDSSSSSSSDSD